MFANTQAKEQVHIYLKHIIHSRFPLSHISSLYYCCITDRQSSPTYRGKCVFSHVVKVEKRYLHFFQATIYQVERVLNNVLQKFFIAKQEFKATHFTQYKPPLATLPYSVPPSVLISTTVYASYLVRYTGKQKTLFITFETKI